MRAIYHCKRGTAFHSLGMRTTAHDGTAWTIIDAASTVFAAMERWWFFQVWTSGGLTGRVGNLAGTCGLKEHLGDSTCLSLHQWRFRHSTFCSGCYLVLITLSIYSFPLVQHLTHWVLLGWPWLLSCYLQLDKPLKSSVAWGGMVTYCRHCNVPCKQPFPLCCPHCWEWFQQHVRGTTYTAYCGTSNIHSFERFLPHLFLQGHKAAYKMK